MVAAVLLQMSPNRSPTLSLLALSPLPEPHRHQRVCHHLESRRPCVGGHIAAAVSSAATERHTCGLQHRTQLRWRKRHRYCHRHRFMYRHRYRCSTHQCASVKSVQHSQNGQRGLCLAHVNGSKLSEHMRTHQQGGQLNGPTCNITSIISVKLCALVSLYHVM